MGCCTSRSKIRGYSNMQMGDGNQGAAVGTTVALLERDLLCLQYTKDLHSMRSEFRLLQNYLNNNTTNYPYDVVGGKRIKQLTLTIK